MDEENRKKEKQMEASKLSMIFFLESSRMFSDKDMKFCIETSLEAVSIIIYLILIQTLPENRHDQMLDVVRNSVKKMLREGLEKNDNKS